ncbi:hypothetical protein D3C80_1879010 [compost metagenome]
MLLDEGTQAFQFVFAFEEERSFIDVSLVMGGVDDAVLHIVVQIGAGSYCDALLVDGLIEPFQQRRIGPGLIRGMYYLVLPMTQGGLHDSVFAGGRDFVPLLQFDEHGMLGA